MHCWMTEESIMPFTIPHLPCFFYSEDSLTGDVLFTKTHRIPLHFFLVPCYNTPLRKESFRKYQTHRHNSTPAHTVDSPSTVKISAPADPFRGALFNKYKTFTGGNYETYCNRPARVIRSVRTAACRAKCSGAPRAKCSARFPCGTVRIG